MPWNVFIDNNRLYHRTIVEVGGNAQLSALIVNLQLPVVMIQVGRAMRPEHAELSHRDHVAIADAVLAGDAGAAEAGDAPACARIARLDPDAARQRLQAGPVAAGELRRTNRADSVPGRGSDRLPGAKTQRASKPCPNRRSLRHAVPGPSAP